MANSSGSGDYHQSYPGKRQRVRSPSRHRRMNSSSEKPTVSTYNKHIVDGRSIYTEELAKGSIRVMTLHRGSGSDVLKCHLRKLQLASTPDQRTQPYEALSYVWGSQEDPEFVLIGGEHFAITQNLFEALVHLRCRDADRTLWVDAICINQCKKSEKTVQIQQMHQVYGNARDVIAWIGGPSPGIHEIFDTITQHELMIKDILCAEPKSSKGLNLILGNESLKERREASLKELAERPYWFRAWTFQEMQFATSLKLMCGYYQVPYSGLESLYIHKGAVAVIGPTNDDDDDDAVTHFRDNLDSTFPELTRDRDFTQYFLESLLNRRCCDRRDNIFAFWHLFPTNLRQNIPIDYGIEPNELLIQTVKAIINSTESLYILLIKARQIPPTDPDEDWQKSLPSWCPYLSTPYHTSGFPPQTSPSVYSMNPVVSFGTENKLRVRGFVVGWVEQSIRRKTALQPNGKADLKNAELQQEFEFYTKCLKRGLFLSPREMTCDSLRATTQTLLADPDGDPVGTRALIDLASGQASHETDKMGARTALRKMRRNTVSRRVCSVQVGTAVLKALHSSEATRRLWLNPIAVVPRAAQRGDAICIILGCPLPIVLRKTGNIYGIIGESFFDTSYMGPLEISIGLRNIPIS